jgi:hypothetical protein
VKCKYRYVVGDRSVIAGKKQVDDPCMARSAKPENGGYCPGHARQMGTMPPEVVAAAIAKRRVSLDARMARGKANKERLANGVAGAIVENIGKKHDIDPRVLVALGLDSQNDLEYEYKVFVATNAKPGVKDWNEKMAFARWMSAPEHLRFPKTLDEAAKILGLSVRALTMWKTSPEIINFINDDTKSRMMGLYRLTMYEMGAGVVRGDVQCMKEVIRHCEKMEETSKDKRRALDIPKDMQQQADDFARATNTVNKDDALKSEKGMHREKYFNATLNKEEIN